MTTERTDMSTTEEPETSDGEDTPQDAPPVEADEPETTEGEEESE